MIAADKVAHLKWGTAVAVGVWALLWVSTCWGMPLAVGLAGVAIAYVLERYQAIRREGTASWKDGVATALPFELLALVLWGLR
jgi:hypothetical protein